MDPAGVRLFEFWSTKIVLYSIAGTLIILLVLNRFRSKFSARVQSWFRTIFEIRPVIFFTIFSLSAIRYLVFLFQYYLVLVGLGLEMDPGIAFNLIAVTFLVSSIVPTFAFSEIATRGAAAIYLFGAFTEDTDIVLVASFLVWIINLALPAIIGTAFIWRLKFFKS
jgi:hypothetical protein